MLPVIESNVVETILREGIELCPHVIQDTCAILKKECPLFDSKIGSTKGYRVCDTFKKQNSIDTYPHLVGKVSKKFNSMKSSLILEIPPSSLKLKPDFGYDHLIVCDDDGGEFSTIDLACV